MNSNTTARRARRLYFRLNPEPRRMNPREAAFLRHQQDRWLRPDAQRWVQQDAGRYLRPGSDANKVFGFNERKYSNNQPRVPAGSGRESGRWTDGSSGGASGSIAPPINGIDFGDLQSFGDLFQVSPDELDTTDFTQLAGDIPNGDAPGIGHNQGPPLEPEIPEQKPEQRSDRIQFLKDAATWLGQVGKASLPGQIFLGTMNNIEWLDDYQHIAQTYNDSPKPLEELQADVANPEKGYQIHHIMEQTAAERWGLSRSEIDDPSNLVRVPTMKHWEITGWYSRANEDFGYLSPRDYLSDKDQVERYRVGLYALRLHGVLKP